MILTLRRKSEPVAAPAVKAPRSVNVLGIDPSMTSTGLVLLNGSKGLPVTERVVKTVKTDPKKNTMHERRMIICDAIIDILNAWRPERVVIEGYGLNARNMGTVVNLVELGGLIRYYLIRYGYAYLEPSPSSLKKFTTGKGNGDKAAIMMHVLKRWKFEAASHDIADAYALAMMGLAHADTVTMTLDQRKIIESLAVVTK